MHLRTKLLLTFIAVVLLTVGTILIAAFVASSQMNARYAQGRDVFWGNFAGVTLLDEGQTAEQGLASSTYTYTLEIDLDRVLPPLSLVAGDEHTDIEGKDALILPASASILRVQVVDTVSPGLFAGSLFQLGAARSEATVLEGTTSYSWGAVKPTAWTADIDVNWNGEKSIQMQSHSGEIQRRVDRDQTLNLQWKKWAIEATTSEVGLLRTLQSTIAGVRAEHIRTQDVQVTVPAAAPRTASTAEPRDTASKALAAESEAQVKIEKRLVQRTAWVAALINFESGADALPNEVWPAFSRMSASKVQWSSTGAESSAIARLGPLVLNDVQLQSNLEKSTTYYDAEWILSAQSAEYAGTTFGMVGAVANATAIPVSEIGNPVRLVQAFAYGTNSWKSEAQQAVWRDLISQGTSIDIRLQANKTQSASEGTAYWKLQAGMLENDAINRRTLYPNRVREHTQLLSVIQLPRSWVSKGADDSEQWKQWLQWYVQTRRMGYWQQAEQQLSSVWAYEKGRIQINGKRFSNAFDRLPTLQ